MYTLTMDRENYWDDDLAIACETSLVYFPQWKEELSILADVVSGVDVHDSLFMESSIRLFRFVIVQSGLSINY